MEAPIIKLETPSRAAERRSHTIPALVGREAREALRASERTQSNEPAPGGTHIDPARQQRQGGLERTAALRFHPYCPRRRPADDHRPPRFIAFFSAHISKGNTRLADRDIAGPASRQTWIL